MSGTNATEDRTSGRVAICHEWLVRAAGSEKVAARLAETVRACDVYAYASVREVESRVFPNQKVLASRIGRTGFGARHYRWLLPLMSRWWRRLDLSSYDLVVTCSHSTVNSVRVRPGSRHVSYCCTPMRYAWMWRSESARLPRAMRPLLPVVAAVLRRSDRRRARNVDLFLAVSEHVAERISRCYGRDSVVVYPPVDVDFFTPDPSVPKEDFFLYAGRVVAYKRVDVAIRAAHRAGVRLVVAGSGPELRRLRRIAGQGVEFRENPSDEELRDLYRRAKALVFPGVEDFGIVLVEAQACGTPVISYAAGGAIEVVRNGQTGVLYTDSSVEGLAEVIQQFDSKAFDTRSMRRQAEKFGASQFDEAIRASVLAFTESGEYATP